MSGCLRLFVECVQGPSVFTSNHVRLQDVLQVSLDTEFMGSEAVIVKNGRRICGTGGALGNAPLVQNKSYFEVKIQSSTGPWGIGLGTKKLDLNKPSQAGQNSEGVILKEDGNIYFNGQIMNALSPKPEEGDIIGITFDHMEIGFYVNGERTNCTVPAIKATTIYPVVFVDDGAILDVQFSEFYHRIPDGFDKIMLEQTLL